MKKKRIALIINESKVVLHYIIKDLVEAGFTVIFCRQAMEAFRQFVDPCFQPSVVLMSTYFSYGRETGDRESYGFKSCLNTHRALRILVPDVPIVIFSMDNDALVRLKRLRDSRLHVFNIIATQERKVSKRAISLALS